MNDAITKFVFDDEKQDWFNIPTAHKSINGEVLEKIRNLQQLRILSKYYQEQLSQKPDLASKIKPILEKFIFD